MKVLFVRSGNGAIEPISDRQAISLREKGVNVDLFSIKGKGLLGYLKSIFHIRRQIISKPIDIVHAHYGLSGIVAYFASTNQKVVVSFMGDDIIGSNRSDGSLIIWSKFIVKINIFFACKLYNHSIAKSAEIFNRINCSKVTLIPNGVDLKLYQKIDKQVARNIIGIENEINLVIFVSNPNRAEKNYTLAKKALEILNDPNTVILCLYDKSQADLVNYYYAADLLLLTSYHEGSPNVVKEAMACNCPAVSTDVGDVKMLFGDTPGYYLTNFDPSEVALKIKLALDFRKKHGHTEGRKRIIDLRLDSENIAERLIEVYKEVLIVNQQ
jgi:teichuronic acid biosynthesis glycosyltransferase TuaC